MATLLRRLGLLSSIGLVIGITIGGGIFRTPAGIATRTSLTISIPVATPSPTGFRAFVVTAMWDILNEV